MKKTESTTRSQIDKFKVAARELGCDNDESAFDVKLRKIATHKPPREDGAPAGKPKLPKVGR